jgi:hypothetical protein
VRTPGLVVPALPACFDSGATRWGLWFGVGIAGFSAPMTDIIGWLLSECQDARAARAVAVPASLENPPGLRASLATVGAAVDPGRQALSTCAGDLKAHGGWRPPAWLNGGHAAWIGLIAEQGQAAGVAR